MFIINLLKIICNKIVKCETKTLYFVWIPAFAGMTKTLGNVITQPPQLGNIFLLNSKKY